MYNNTWLENNYIYRIIPETGKQKHWYGFSQPDHFIPNYTYICSNGIYNCNTVSEQSVFVLPGIKTTGVKIESQITATETGYHVTVSFSPKEPEEEHNYLIPPAISKERFLAFTDKLSKKDRKKLSNYFRLIPSKRSNEFIDSYPGLAQGDLYILKDDILPDKMEWLETLFKDLGYTEEDFILDHSNVSEANQHLPECPIEYTVNAAEHISNIADVLHVFGVCDRINSAVYACFNELMNQPNQQAATNLIHSNYVMDGIIYNISSIHAEKTDNCLIIHLEIVPEK